MPLVDQLDKPEEQISQIVDRHDGNGRLLRRLIARYGLEGRGGSVLALGSTTVS